MPSDANDASKRHSEGRNAGHVDAVVNYHHHCAGATLTTTLAWMPSRQLMTMMSWPSWEVPFRSFSLLQMIASRLCQATCYLHCSGDAACHTSKSPWQMLGSMEPPSSRASSVRWTMAEHCHRLKSGLSHGYASCYSEHPC